MVYGILSLGWDTHWAAYLTIFGACLGTQAIGNAVTGKDWRSFKSAAITALGLCLLLKANMLWAFTLAGVVAIGSKFLIRFHGKHLFNPANIGIVAAVALTQEAWISPGQWGSNVILLFVLGVLGTVVLLRVGRIDTSLVFLVVFSALQFGWNVLYKGWPADFFFHQMTNGALLLFTFFMITDPVTTPNTRKARIVWATLIAVVAFLLSSEYYVHTAPIWALVFITPLTVPLDHYLKGKKFSWYQ